MVILFNQLYVLFHFVLVLNAMFLLDVFNFTKII